MVRESLTEKAIDRACDCLGKSVPGEGSSMCKGAGVRASLELGDRGG